MIYPTQLKKTYEFESELLEGVRRSPPNLGILKMRDAQAALAIGSAGVAPEKAVK